MRVGGQGGGQPGSRGALTATREELRKSRLRSWAHVRQVGAMSNPEPGGAPGLSDVACLDSIQRDVDLAFRGLARRD